MHCRNGCLTVVQIVCSALQELWRGEVQQISWKPRAFVLKNFMSTEECDYLVKKASLILPTFWHS